MCTPRPKEAAKEAKEEEKKGDHLRCQVKKIDVTYATVLTTLQETVPRPKAREKVTKAKAKESTEMAKVEKETAEKRRNGIPIETNGSLTIRDHRCLNGWHGTRQEEPQRPKR